MVSGIDISFMQRALNLAELARGRTSPNPIVGAVIVKDGNVIGEGYHQRAGADHAEVAAIKAAGGDVKDATVYVTLEPCCHTGRTGPCTSALIEAGVARVLVASLDPSAKVNGKGVKLLEAAGIEVEILNGAVAARARSQNEAFRKHAVTGLPFVIFKSAMSLDGKIATSTGDSRWISGEESRALVHAMRAEADAIAVGSGTAAIDDPMLTCRLPGDYKQPLRIVFDSGAGMDPASKLAKTAKDVKTLVFVVEGASPERTRSLQKAGIDVIETSASEGRVAVGEALTRLGSMDPPVLSLLLEGGPTLAASFVEAGVVDKVMFFVAPRIIGGQAARTPVEGQGFRLVGESMPLYRMGYGQIGDDILITAYTAEEEW
ncbi:MAG: bifunctional diaminohydroxyphosphoribosylaminopyrimidine deaminase/5-amino-6-(5-phosphoribosylamino)uracil reductase RibD [Actinobacteria bacterium]|nr:bifunctional diaminohydroxyphosphoribosylaminopyrimidine deaminase/5-amino-6-(5-phosphoribosylamino)uracil reductase RibD [Actinomycetota bacterium]